MSSLKLSPLNLSRYEWLQQSATPSTWQRAALAGENMWIHRPREHHDLFLACELTLTSSCTEGNAVSAITNAWRQLRFEVPELALSPHLDSAGYASLLYHVPADDNQVRESLERTLFFSQLDEPDLEALKKEVIMRKGNHGSDLAFLALHIGYKQGNVASRTIRLLLNCHHQITDGIGIRILLDRYLSILATNIKANYLNNPEPVLDWAGSVKNLSKPWISMMNTDQVISGSTYEDQVAFNLQVLSQKMRKNWGLPVLPISSPANQESHSITIKEDETSILLKTIKTTIGQEANITHLGHAAMVLAILKANPLPPTSKSELFSPCWLNGRRYLTPTNPPATTSYIPICQSFAPIIFPDLQSLVLPANASRIEIRDMVIKATKIAVGEYGKLKARKSVLPESVALLEFFGKQMFETKKEPSLSTSKKSIADPFFLSDGITETYISHTYPKSPNTKSSEEEEEEEEIQDPIITVNKVTFTANAEGPNLIVRMSSWRGKITISGEWRNCDYERGFVRGVLVDVGAFMGVLV